MDPPPAPPPQLLIKDLVAESKPTKGKNAEKDGKKSVKQKPESKAQSRQERMREYDRRTAESRTKKLKKANGLGTATLSTAIPLPVLTNMELIRCLAEGPHIHARSAAPTKVAPPLQAPATTPYVPPTPDPADLEAPEPDPPPPEAPPAFEPPKQLLWRTSKPKRIPPTVYSAAGSTFSQFGGNELSRVWTSAEGSAPVQWQPDPKASAPPTTQPGVDQEQVQELSAQIQYVQVQSALDGMLHQRNQLQQTLQELQREMATLQREVKTRRQERSRPTSTTLSGQPDAMDLLSSHGAANSSRMADLLAKREAARASANPRPSQSSTVAEEKAIHALRSRERAAIRSLEGFDQSIKKAEQDVARAQKELKS